MHFFIHYSSQSITGNSKLILFSTFLSWAHDIMSLTCPKRLVDYTYRLSSKAYLVFGTELDFTVFIELAVSLDWKLLALYFHQFQLTPLHMDIHAPFLLTFLWHHSHQLLSYRFTCPVYCLLKIWRFPQDNYPISLHTICQRSQNRIYL